MSHFLYFRNVVMELVAKFCHSELEAYGSCVQDNPQSWPTKCAELKKKVSNCSSTHPSIQRIKRECHKQFQMYDYCIRNNPSEVEVCLPALQEFFTCGHTAASDQQLKDDMPTPQKAAA
ncbi:coiled-coil-helix-coiled-coil-helix domain-containing protein 5-like [Branchiostoma floridae x Branchiostoma belcheri]